MENDSGYNGDNGLGISGLKALGWVFGLVAVGSVLRLLSFAAEVGPGASRPSQPFP